MMSSKRPLLLALCAASGLFGCGIARPNQLGQQQCPTFVTDIAPRLEGCADCHSGSAPAAGYRVDDYFSVTARRPDGTGRVVPADSSSAFLRAARGELPPHQALPEEDQNLLTDWVVRCRAENIQHRVHLPGWMTRTDDEQFHGRVLRGTAYDLSTCKDCHGADFAGGTSQVSCLACHPSGPLACNVCHGDPAASVTDLRNAAPPKDLSGATLTTSLGVGAHQQHLSDGPLHKAYPCTVCHVLPGDPEAPGHYRVDAGTGEVAEDPRPAELSVRGSPGQEPLWNRDNATCASVYCHDPLGAPDSNARNTTPTWTKVGQFEAACGTCHGFPPATPVHADNRCPVCHGVAYSQDAGVVLARHANGTTDLGNTEFPACSGVNPPAICACNGCHGDGTTAAPPRDLLGRTSESLRTVGAHRAHLDATGRLFSNPVACSECHEVPANVTSPGHLDSPPPADLFPAVAGVGAIARADGAVPAYDPATGTCSNVYCHGGGARGARDATPGLLRTPSWTGGPSQVTCGTCHGVPPLDTVHPVGATPPCFNCHFQTIAPTGEIKFDGGFTSHVNGTVELGGP